MSEDGQEIDCPAIRLAELLKAALEAEGRDNLVGAGPISEPILIDGHFNLLRVAREILASAPAGGSTLAAL